MSASYTLLDVYLVYFAVFISLSFKEYWVRRTWIVLILNSFLFFQKFFVFVCGISFSQTLCVQSAHQVLLSNAAYRISPSALHRCVIIHLSPLAVPLHFQKSLCIWKGSGGRLYIHSWNFCFPNCHLVCSCKLSPSRFKRDMAVGEKVLQL